MTHPTLPDGIEVTTLDDSGLLINYKGQNLALIAIPAVWPDGEHYRHDPTLPEDEAPKPYEYALYGWVDYQQNPDDDAGEFIQVHKGALEVDKSHPAACPYCGSIHVNIVVPDLDARSAILRADGTVLADTSGEGCDWQHGEFFYCYGCSSEFMLPEGVHVEYDDMKDPRYPSPPFPGDAKYIGARIVWTPSVVFPEKEQT